MMFIKQLQNLILILNPILNPNLNLIPCFRIRNRDFRSRSNTAKIPW